MENGPGAYGTVDLPATGNASGGSCSGNTNLGTPPNVSSELGDQLPSGSLVVGGCLSVKSGASQPSANVVNGLAPANDAMGQDLLDIGGGQYQVKPQSWDDASGLPPRLMAVPIVQSLPGGNGNATITGFAWFYVTSATNQRQQADHQRAMGQPPDLPPQDRPPHTNRAPKAKSSPSNSPSSRKVLKVGVQSPRRQVSYWCRQRPRDPLEPGWASTRPVQPTLEADLWRGGTTSAVVTPAVAVWRCLQVGDRVWLGHASPGHEAIWDSHGGPRTGVGGTCGRGLRRPKRDSPGTAAACVGRAPGRLRKRDLASLTRGDGCAAAQQERQLQQAVAAAVAAGQVPVALRAPLSNSVRSLAGEIRCVGPPPVTPPSDHKHRHEGDKHGNGSGQGDGGDGGGN